MMEQADSCEGHHHSIFIAGLDHCVVAHGATRFSYILHTALMGSLNIVAEREEGVRAKSHICEAVQPCAFLFSCEHFRLLGKNLLPCAIRQYIHIFLADIYVNRVVSLRTADLFTEGKVHHLRALTEEPVVSFLARQSCTVNTGLLACAYTDGLSVFYIAYGIGLCIL